MNLSELKAKLNEVLDKSDRREGTYLSEESKNILATLGLDASDIITDDYYDFQAVEFVIKVLSILDKPE
ncbi:MAG: hypothetical protein WC325_13495 [Candidatus Bathyarchaeia archaeon]|jgi:hypothetical protein